MLCQELSPSDHWEIGVQTPPKGFWRSGQTGHCSQTGGRHLTGNTKPTMHSPVSRKSGWWDCPQEVICRTPCELRIIKGRLKPLIVWSKCQAFPGAPDLCTKADWRKMPTRWNRLSLTPLVHEQKAEIQIFFFCKCGSNPRKNKEQNVASLIEGTVSPKPEICKPRF